MIILTKGNIEQVYCTPLENADSVFSLFYFKFTNRITQDITAFISNNISTFERYQQFEIDTVAEFIGAETGFFTYEIYQADPDTEQPIGPVLESGYMYLNPEIAFEPIKYDDQDNTFITYNG